MFNEFYLQQGEGISLEQYELWNTIIFLWMQYQTIMNNAMSLFVLFQFFECHYFMHEWLPKRLKDFNIHFENQNRDGIEKGQIINEKKKNSTSAQIKYFNGDKTKNLMRKWFSEYGRKNEFQPVNPKQIIKQNFKSNKIFLIEQALKSKFRDYTLADQNQKIQNIG